MAYTKAALSFEEQADQLIERGLLADRNELIGRLQAVNYYRLSGYLHPFRIRDAQGQVADEFHDGTTLETVWKRYCFDRRLRVLVLDAVERIEVALRTRLVYDFTHAYGPFGYGEQVHFPQMPNDAYLKWRTGLEEETSRSHEEFVKHFRKKYGKDHPMLPLWILAEVMSMGRLLDFFKGVNERFRKRVGQCFGVPAEVIQSWLQSLYGARNVCAHHARFWNRPLRSAPMLPREKINTELFKFTGLRQDRCGVVLLICRYLLKRISPTSCWAARVEALFAEYPEIPLEPLGLPEAWQTLPVWQAARLQPSEEPACLSS